MKRFLLAVSAACLFASSAIADPAAKPDVKAAALADAKPLPSTALPLRPDPAKVAASKITMTIGEMQSLKTYFATSQHAADQTAEAQELAQLRQAIEQAMPALASVNEQMAAALKAATPAPESPKK